MTTPATPSANPRDETGTSGSPNDCFIRGPGAIGSDTPANVVSVTADPPAGQQVATDSNGGRLGIWTTDFRRFSVVRLADGAVLTESGSQAQATTFANAITAAGQA